MYIQSPGQIPAHVTDNGVFIGGGISNCPNWQEEIIPLIDGNRYIIFNPRRVGDLAKEGDEAIAQIKWEYAAIERCSTLLFWFPKESICPITLFELGKAFVWAQQGMITKLIVGNDAEYSRAFDIAVQIYAAGLDKVARFSSTNQRKTVLLYSNHFEDFKNDIKMELNEDGSLTKEYGGDYTISKNGVDTGKIN